MSTLLPFKGRQVDWSRPVQVYRNLNGDGAHRWSIRQGGLVVAHADALFLIEASFHVSGAGWSRRQREGRRNVYAWATGRLMNFRSPPVSVQSEIRFAGDSFRERRGNFEVWDAEELWFLDRTSIGPRSVYSTVVANYVGYYR